MEKPKSPPFTIVQLLAALADGQFKIMNDIDFQSYLDAPHGSLISRMFIGWEILICPDEKSNPTYEAYWYSEEPGLDAFFHLVNGQWEEI